MRVFCSRLLLLCICICICVSLGYAKKHHAHHNRICHLYSTLFQSPSPSQSHFQFQFPLSWSFFNLICSSDFRSFKACCFLLSVCLCVCLYLYLFLFLFLSCSLARCACRRQFIAFLLWFCVNFFGQHRRYWGTLSIVLSVRVSLPISLSYSLSPSLFLCESV